MLANVDSNLLTLMMMMRVHEDPLNQVVAVLVAGNVNKWDAWTVRTSRSDDSKIAIQEIKTANLEALLNDFRSELINAVAVRVGENVVNDTSLVWR